MFRINDQDRPSDSHCRWFPGYPSQVAAARWFVIDRLHGCSRADDASLLASELATNAIRHTRSRRWRTGFLLTVDHTPGLRLRVTVRDAGALETDKKPCATLPAPDALHGRGLFLVNSIASRWGTRREHLGRKTWFELDCHR
ncbi:Anti-sigma regulatory factor (Ser/Thr protein kinase) [Marinactinospora thermotolerans DSM 45154]|uniref:Anti-sigma regulatory factor (Ser/Thr protein kinase) n=1 Tax=Marinactinospora thermotolerans DSM 45154 TaxID=1122192 RepID=A0A1T4SRU4_9ACTN|nr:ATP-binding protein [Marinactinospora thermotolerans]SKA30965.1 Anti-sigma regulatory factor (Ser/Thr protein kinase) [Marinactinospora thermotolerans DSM 45154]